MTTESLCNAKRAAAVAGISIQMLDYLEREGVFEREQVRADPKCRRRQKGVRRSYSFRDLVVLRSIARLLTKGVSVRRIRQAMETFCRDERFECDRSRVSWDAAAVQYFVTDGVDIYFQPDGAELVSVLGRGQQAFLFVLDIEKVRLEVDGLVPAQATPQKTVR